MIKPVAILCARDVIVDKGTNTASIFTILEQLTPEGLPTALPTIVVFSLMEREPDDPDKVKCKLTITLDDTKIGEMPELSIDFQKALRNRLMVKIDGLVVPKPGKLKFSIACQGRKLHSYEVDIRPPEKPPKMELKKP